MSSRALTPGNDLLTASKRRKCWVLSIRNLVPNPLLFEYRSIVVAVDEDAGGARIQRRLGAVFHPFKKHFGGFITVAFGRQQSGGEETCGGWVLPLRHGSGFFVSRAGGRFRLLRPAL